ncbi:hypothetical protein [Parabacteroides distasonis]|uniref:hypothetical protein n=1 Tax=Parabacteroides distasonis TaxID=823 RepID=UPI002164B881|nr:hypothetical protein [Parabacteroides distasonis]UVR14472.1 hypothetical protein NXW68_03350 [Parabacteroides distasonis]
MATKTGAAEHFFKLNEGKPGDGVCALFDSPDKKLRIYCIRFANVAIVVGGGGYKPKNIRAYQESSSLKKKLKQWFEYPESYQKPSKTRIYISMITVFS